MIEKEKAVELVYWFYNRLEHTFNEEYDKHSWKTCKMCASKIADEMIEETRSKYWYNVKHEIEKL